MPKRIAILLPDLRVGGVEQVRVLLAQEFLRAGHAVEFILVKARGHLLASVPGGATVTNLDCSRFRYAAPRLLRHLRADPPDVLLAAMWPISGMAIVANRLIGSPSTLVVSEHTDLRRSAAITRPHRLILARLGDAIYGRAHATIAVSQGVRESIAELTRLATERITVIYDPVREPTTAPLPDDELTRWWRGGQAALIAVGNLKPAKGFDLLIDAVARLRAAGTDARLLILGEGPDVQFLHDEIARLGVAGGVRLPGYRADPYPYLRAADLFVLSSRWEGLGNVITEALACGTPVVAADCASGPSELLDGGRYGTLVAPDDPAALAQGIRDALAAPADPAPLIERARAFTPARAAAAYLAAMGLAPAE